MGRHKLLTNDTKKLSYMDRMKDTTVNGLCSLCGDRPIYIKKSKLCQTCYGRVRLGITTPPRKDFGGVDKNEKSFIKSFFNHTSWVYHPCSFPLNGTKYGPDFYDIKRKVFIEVVGTRQAYHKNKEKYDMFIKMYPFIPLEFRDSSGNLLNIDYRGNIHWDGSNGVHMKLVRLNFYDRFQEPDHKKKLSKIDIKNIRNDSRKLQAIADDYGIRMQYVWSIKHYKARATLKEIS